MRVARRSRALERWYENADSSAVATVQDARLRRLVRHAVTRSPFYAERLRAVDLEAPDLLRRLPPLDKTAMMADLPRVLTDAGLRGIDLEAHLEGLRGDELLLGRYRVMSTSGTSGVRAILVWDREAWVEVLRVYAAFMGSQGLGPRLPRRRVASILAHGPAHMSARVPMSLSAPTRRRLRLAATMPVPELVSALNAFRPDALVAFPSNAAFLADEQLAGRLSISPATIVVTAAECSPSRRARIEAAWSSQPFDIYATTEAGPMAVECEAHAGMHILEDRVIVEQLDGRLLVTNLLNLAQPIIRYELSDIVTIDPSPCPCGRAGRRITAIEGRLDDVMHLPDASGNLVPVYPSHFQEPLESTPGVRDHRITQLEGRVEVAVVATRDVTASIADAIRRNLAALGVEGTAVDVLLVPEIDHAPDATGKVRRVRALQRSS
jgi:phenylacetate-coenzyme A ligase PaaK-like adenylate-forming protein